MKCMFGKPIGWKFTLDSLQATYPERKKYLITTWKIIVWFGSSPDSYSETN